MLIFQTLQRYKGPPLITKKKQEWFEWIATNLPIYAPQTFLHHTEKSDFQITRNIISLQIPFRLLIPLTKNMQRSCPEKYSWYTNKGCGLLNLFLWNILLLTTTHPGRRKTKTFLWQRKITTHENIESKMSNRKKIHWNFSEICLMIIGTRLWFTWM